jgi:protein-tyrosine phosphatase
MKYIAGKKYDAGKAGLFLNELYPGENMDVPDPYYGAEPGYHDVYRLIDDTCTAIIKKYSAVNSGKSPDQKTTIKQQ